MRIIPLLLATATLSASSLEEDLETKINQTLRANIGAEAAEIITVDVSIEHELKNQGRCIVASGIQVSVNGQVHPQYDSGAIGVGSSFEEAKETLLQEWLMQYGLPLINAANEKDSIPFGDYLIYTGPTGFRGESPKGWMEGTNELHTRILDAIGVELISSSEASPVTLTLTITVDEKGTFDGECRINGKVSHRLRQKLKSVEWSTSRTGYMLKQFYILEKRKTQPSGGHNSGSSAASIVTP